MVTRVKAQIQVARPGQVLEIARFAAATLANRSPSLYAQLLTGLQQGSPSRGEPEAKAALAMIVTDRKARWRELCEEDADVRYWQQTIDQYRAEFGANAAVEDLIAEDDRVDLRRFVKGKKVREELLRKAGLSREGTNLVPLKTDKDEVDSLVGGHPPEPREGKKEEQAGDGMRNLMEALHALTARLERVEGQTLQGAVDSQAARPGASTTSTSSVSSAPARVPPSPGPRSGSA